MKRSEHTEVVIVTHNSSRHVGACVESILAAGALPIIVDTGSTDNTLETVRSRSPRAKIIATGEDIGCCRGLNLGFKETTGDFVILSNPDVVFLDDSISQMTGFLRKNQNVGVTGPQQMFPDRSWQRSYGDLPGMWSGIRDAMGITTLRNGARKMLWPRRIDRKPKEVPYVDGAVLALRREAFVEMRGFDEEFFMYSGECDLCARLKKAGWKVVFFPPAEVIHIRGADSTRIDNSDRFPKQMVDGLDRLTKRVLPLWQAKFYMRSEWLSFVLKGAVCRCAKIVLSKRVGTRMMGRIQLFETFSRAFHEYLTEGLGEEKGNNFGGCTATDTETSDRDAAGPTGAEATGYNAEAMSSGVLTYSRSKGLFAGVSLDGASIEADNDANKKLYGKELDAQEIGTGSQEVMPAAKPLVSLLDTTSPHRS